MKEIEVEADRLVFDRMTITITLLEWRTYKTLLVTNEVLNRTNNIYFVNIMHETHPLFIAHKLGIVTSYIIRGNR